MRILWVKADKLLPVHSGGNIRSYHILRHLSQHNDLTFFSYYDGDRDEKYEHELAEHLPGAIAVCTKKTELHGAMRALDYLFRLPNRPPYAVSRFASFGIQERVRDWFRQKQFDVAVCDFLDAAVNFPGKFIIPSVLFQHNVESEIWRRHAETESSLIKKSMYQVEFQKMLRYEQVMVRKFHHVIAVSENDRQLMSKWCDASHITVVPTGVDLGQYKPASSQTPAHPLIIFVGAMDWEPNIDGVDYFCGQILPLIKAQVPAARFRIVGRNPDKRVQRWASESIEVTGRVASVVHHLREALAVIVPLRIGGGTRLKIYEAMACGRAVISTTVGAEGLSVNTGHDILLADTPQQFAEAVVNVMNNESFRRQLEANAASTAAKYDWPVIGRTFHEVLAGVADAQRSPSLSRAVPALNRGNS